MAAADAQLRRMGRFLAFLPGCGKAEQLHSIYPAGAGREAEVSAALEYCFDMQGLGTARDPSYCALAALGGARKVPGYYTSNPVRVTQAAKLPFSRARGPAQNTQCAHQAAGPLIGMSRDLAAPSSCMLQPRTVWKLAAAGLSPDP
jgi:hypothetical protein